MTIVDPVFELDLAPDDVPALLRQPELLVPGTRRRLATGRTVKSALLWHDTAEGELASAGLALSRGSERGAMWRLERLQPEAGETAAPGTPPRRLEERDTPPEAQAGRLLPVAAFDSQSRDLRPASNPPRVVLRQGELRAVAAQVPLARVIISGPGAAELALEWSTRLRLSARSESLAGQALRLAGRVVPTRPLGAPTLDPAQSVSEAFALIVAHLAGVMTHYASLADGAHGPEPVHQMRVALRRLRSATSLFRRPVACPELSAVNDRLKQIGRVLGPARDWDVFLLGTGAGLGDAFSEDPGVQSLLAAARRKRAAGYAALAAYLDSAEWRALGISLAALATARPWEIAAESDAEISPEADAEPPAPPHHARPLVEFAGRALSRRYRDVVAPGADLSGLDVEALHAIRLQCKRLRYACEFFAPLYPGRATKRFLRRLSELQETLGQMNDGAVAAGLMAELGGRGAVRSEAVGIVRGYVAAGSSSERQRIERSWQRLLKLDCFWA